MPQASTVTVLGSTGSIGDSTLDLLHRHRDRYRVFALSARRSVAKMHTQCKQFTPRYAVMEDADAAEQLQRLVRDDGLQTEVLAGIDGLQQIASMPQVDTVVAGIVGAAGLLPTLAAVRHGKRILLANKEALVMTGDLLLRLARQHGATVLPVDSEHNAIFQSLPQTADGIDLAGVDKILLTASGGPFRTWSMEQLQHATVEQAVAHPNWDMGRKISVDSATLMNKGLELIEACLLFAVSPQRVKVVVHPQSVIHSLVSYVDGSVLAQLGQPDMRTPIAHVLAWPQRIDAGVAELDLFAVAQLNFEHPDTTRFPCLELAYQAGTEGGIRPTVLNAANEIAVQAFLDRQIGFMQIPQCIEQTLSQVPSGPATDLDCILAADRLAREYAQQIVGQMR